MSGGRVILTAALALVATGCPAKGRAPGQEPSWRRRGDGRAERPRFIELRPERPGAPRYNDPRTEPVPETALGAAVIDAVTRAAGQLGRPIPRPDARLFAVAAELAGVAPDDAPLAYGVTEFALQHAGIIEPTPHLVIIRAPLDDPRAIADTVAERLPAILSTTDFARVGVGAAERSGDDDVVVLALQSSFVTTGPIDRALPADGEVKLDGEVAPPFLGPEVYVTRPAGEVERVPVTRVGQRGFRAALTCGDHVGKQQIEINAADDSGSTVLANFPIWCGESPPDRITVALGDDDVRPPTSGEEAEARMLELVNRDRVAAGLAALAVDPRAVAIARAHSEDMRRTGLVGHISPTTGSAADRTRRAGVRTAVVLENVARAYGVTEAEAGLMNSPGHRANILTREANRIGVGIALGEEVAGRRELFVTQLFIRVVDKLDAAAARRQIVGELAARRALDEDAVLDGIAQRFADALARGDDGKAASARAAADLRRQGGAYSRVTTVATTLSDLGGLRPADPLADESIIRFGLGVAQGDHEVMGEGALHVVLLFGHR